MNKLDLLKPLIRAIDNCSLYDDFSLSQRVTYQYYVGRKALLDSDYALGMLFFTNISYNISYDNIMYIKCNIYYHKSHLYIIKIICYLDILNNKIKLNVNYRLLS